MADSGIVSVAEAVAVAVAVVVAVAVAVALAKLHSGINSYCKGN